MSLKGHPMRPTRAINSGSISAGLAMHSRSLDPAKGNLVGLAVFFVLAAGVMGPYLLLWGPGSLLLAWRDLSGWLAAVVVFAGLIVHEAIHGVTWLLAGRLGRSDISFGINWTALAPFAHAKVPLRAGAYRVGAAMPAVSLGLVPGLVGALFELPLVACFGAIFLGIAAGDVIVLVLLRSVPRDTLVLDHPTRWGCDVLVPETGSADAAPAATSVSAALTRDDRAPAVGVFLPWIWSLALTVGLFLESTAQLVFTASEVMEGRAYPLQKLLLAVALSVAARQVWARRRGRWQVGMLICLMVFAAVAAALTVRTAVNSGRTATSTVRAVTSPDLALFRPSEAAQVPRTRRP
jgi:hypothetical protein